jgi:ABC-type branched-subunit amino acid transport system ATPase component
MSAELLTIEKLSAGYGGRPVLAGLSLVVRQGERVALIGPNGCGKSTFLRTVTAEVPESSGRVWLRGEDITDLETDAIVCRGIGYLRQTKNIFPGLTVDENLNLAAMDGVGKVGRDRNAVLKAFPMLEGRQEIRAGLLSGGERQALALAMVLLRPVHLLLLDEPVAGLSHKNAAELLNCISALQRNEGFSVVLVEHRLRLIQPTARCIGMFRLLTVCPTESDINYCHHGLTPLKSNIWRNVSPH